VSDADDDLQVSVLPQLSVRRGRAAIEFYEEAFGAIEVYRVGGTDANPDVVAQLSVGSASFWVSDESPEHGELQPRVGGRGHRADAPDRR
jgi:PhnB protein